MANRHPSLSERLWSKVEKTDDCWIWHGAISRGYGRIGINGKQAVVHRVAYELSVGPIPQELTLDHLCRNRVCVRPDHLEIVSRGENTLRGYGPTAINRRKKHCKNGHPLTPPVARITPSGKRRCRQCEADYSRTPTRNAKERVRRRLRHARAALAHSDTREEKKPDGTYWCQVHNRGVIMAVPWMPSAPDPVCRCPKEGEEK